MLAPNVLAAWHWLGALDWAVISTVALVFFAAVQWKLMDHTMDHTEVRRMKERRLDKRQREDIAYGALWAEYARMWSVALQWQSRDFVGETMLDLFEPSDILPRDWASATLHLSELGRLSAHLGGVAYTFATQAELSGRNVLGAIKLIRRKYPNIPEGMAEAEVKMAAAFKMARDKQQNARWFAKQAELILLDAINNSRPGREPQRFPQMKTAESEFGKQLQLQIRDGIDATKLSAPPGPPPLEPTPTQ